LVTLSSLHSDRLRGGLGSDTIALSGRAEVPDDVVYAFDKGVPVIENFEVSDYIFVYTGNPYAGDIGGITPLFTFVHEPYNGTNSGMIGGFPYYILDSNGLIILDHDTNQPGYSVLAQVDGGAANITSSSFSTFNGLTNPPP
jgi:hypothetical protein